MPYRPADRGAGLKEAVANRLHMNLEQFNEQYFRESCIRSKAAFWKFAILPGHLEGRVMARLRLLADQAPPRIWFVYFRTLWNGWVTHDRMKQLLPRRSCL